MFFVDESENFTQPIAMQICKKLIFFSEVFTPCLKSMFNFQCLEKKDVRHCLLFPKL